MLFSLKLAGVGKAAYKLPFESPIDNFAAYFEKPQFSLRAEFLKGTISIAGTNLGNISASAKLCKFLFSTQIKSTNLS